MRGVKTILMATALCCVIAVSMIIGINIAWNESGLANRDQSTNTLVTNNLSVSIDRINTDGSLVAIDKDTALFGEDTVWTPGHAEVVYLALTNTEKTLVNYSLGVKFADGATAKNAAGEEVKLSDLLMFGFANASDFYENPGDAIEDVSVSKTLSSGFSRVGAIDADGAEVLVLVVYLPESAGEITGGAIDLGLSLYVTTPLGAEEQKPAPVIPNYFTGSVNAPAIDTNGATTESVTIGADSQISAVLPEGVKLEDGASELSLSVNGVAESEANVDLQAGDVKLTLDVHVSGVAADNSAPILVTLNTFFPKGLTTGNIKFYHVEDGETIEMTQVDTLAELDAHNEFYYDKDTGAVTLAMASFSEVVAAVAMDNPWQGGVDTSWYNTTDSTFTLEDADDLAGFALIVGGMADGIEQDSFTGKTVKLDDDINLGGKIFKPIGYHYEENHTFDNGTTGVYSTVYSFEGTFDGQGNTVSNWYQNTWEIKGDYESKYYKDGMGLFGYVLNGTIKNLTVDSFSSDGEFTPTGCVAAYACNSTFSDISIRNCNPRVYNTGNGGIVGIGGNNDDTADAMTLTFTNITVDDTNKISALWGSWDVGCGGIIGMYRGAGKVNMTNCEVAAEIDVYNDVCGNYQYYQYRYSGMLIGTVGRDGDPSDEAQNFTFEECRVNYGDWAEYYYCELVANSLASYTHDHQMSRLTKISNIGEISDSSGWTKTGNFLLIDANGNKTCYHIVKNADGKLVEHKHDVADSYNTEIYETVDGEQVLKEDKQIVHITFKQLYTGYGWGATAKVDNVDVQEYLYTITYINKGVVLNKVYVTQEMIDAGTIDVNALAGDAASKAEAGMDPLENGEQPEFNYWMNAGSSEVKTIETTDRDIVLYPSFKLLHTISFVDQHGNLIHYQFFVEGENPVIEEPKVPEIVGCTGAWENYTLGNEDITVHPVYTIDESKLSVTPIDVEPQDGIIDYYQINAVNQLDKNVTIPGYINGLPCKVIADLSGDYAGDVESIVIEDGVETINSNAFAWTPKLKEVYIPSSVTSIGSGMFANIYGGGLGDILGRGKIVNITYDGTWAEWLAITGNGNNKWDSGIAAGSTVVCNDGTVYQKTGKSWDTGVNQWSKQ